MCGSSTTGRQESSMSQLPRIHRTAIVCMLACAMLIATAGMTYAASGQDLRNPDNRAETSSSAANPWPKQDLRSPDARDAATANLPGAPTWPTDPKPITSAPAATATAGDSGVDWLTIALAGAAGVLVSGTALVLVMRSRRTQRVRVQV
jgi:hypothetical protein